MKPPATTTADRADAIRVGNSIHTSVPSLHGKKPDKDWWKVKAVTRLANGYVVLDLDGREQLVVPPDRLLRLGWD